MQGHKGLDVWRREFTNCASRSSTTCAPTRSSAPDESGIAVPRPRNQLFFIVPGPGGGRQWLETFKEFPPRQKPASFNVDDVLREDHGCRCTRTRQIA